MPVGSTQKGDRLEHTVFELIQQQLKTGHFPFRPECCRVYLKKGYYSKDRDSEIVFDVSVEIVRPGSDAPMTILLFECKDLGRAVAVDDVEEFFAKAQQVGAAGVKAVVVSTNGFQSGATAFARSKRMGLVRYFAPSLLKWELDRVPVDGRVFSSSSSGALDVESALTSPFYVSRFREFYCFDGHAYSYSLASVVRGLAESGVGEAAALDAARARPPLAQSVVPYVDFADIEATTLDELEAVGYASGEVPLDGIAQRYREMAGLSIRVDVDPGKEAASVGALGRIRFDPLEIVIFKQPKESLPRTKFTLAHELGHLVLRHGRYMRAEYCNVDDLQEDGTLVVGHEDIQRLEWQANRFASCVLLPRRQLLEDVRRIAHRLGLRDRGFGLVYVDHQRVNLASYYVMTNELRSIYRVSRRAVTLRLQGLGLLTDARNKSAPTRVR